MSVDMQEERTRSIVRAGVLWGLMGLMTLLAWLMQVGWVPVSGTSRLPQKVTTGELTLWLPEEWMIIESRAEGAIIAQQQVDGEVAAVLRAFLEDEGRVTPAQMMRQQAGSVIHEEIIPMGNGRGRLRVAVRAAPETLWGLQLGRIDQYVFVVSAVHEVDGRRVTIGMERPITDPSEWDSSDLGLVRRIARHMELQKSAP